MSRLWRDHPATPRQQPLAFRASRGRGRATQADVLLSMLRGARAQGKAVELPEIMAAGIAQHGARFNELRSRGFVIENELDRDGRLSLHSRYRLKHDSELDSTDAK
jgi:hypothetical protein